MSGFQAAETDIREAVFDLEGATCTSCVYAIEHGGRKIKGIDSIHVDAGKGKIFVDYHGNDHVLARITDLVGRLGYSAVLADKQ